MGGRILPVLNFTMASLLMFWEIPPHGCELPLSVNLPTLLFHLVPIEIFTCAGLPCG